LIVALAAPRVGGPAAALVGLLLAMAVALAATEWSRAVAVVLTPLGAGRVLGGMWILARERWPGRVILISVGIVLVAVLAVGLWTLAVALQTEIVEVVRPLRS
jgi:hypothetical protein